MATYRPSFVETSGLSQGISRGLEIAAANKEKEDQLAEARIADFMKTYRPDKLRDNDIIDFTADYTKYKDAALLYSRMNRGGAKPEQLAAAKLNMDKALGGLNNTYTSSAQAANKLAEYANYINTAKQKGYAIPNDVTNTYNALSTTGIKNIDVTKIPSAYTFDLIPKEIDYNGITKILDASNAKQFEKTIQKEKVLYGKDINGNPIYTTAQTKYSGRDPMSTIEMLGKIGNSKGDIANAAKAEYEDLANGIAQNNEGAISRLSEIQQHFPSVKSIKDITPYMVFGLPLYRRQSQGTTVDEKFGQQEYNRIKDMAEFSQKERGISAKAEGKKGEVLSNHPSVIINSVMKKYNTPGLTADKAGIDVTRDFGGFTMPAKVNAYQESKVPLSSVKYVPGDNKATQPYFYITVGDEIKILSPEAFNSQIVQSAPDITFKGGENVYSSIPTGETQPTSKKVGKDASFIVGDKVMTKSELLKLGYTESNIQDALKLNTIKVK